MTTLPSTLAGAASRLVELARKKGVSLACAESCTGGLVAAAITEVPGSSAVLERGFVTYSNAAKAESLGVPVTLIARHGAVSEEVACSMAEGALFHSHAEIAVAITGIAGPDGGSEEKPVGLVWFALARRGGATLTEHHVFTGLNRHGVREAAALEALRLLTEAAS
ncbi:MAG: CinA family protein [Caulobacterales bacterium]|uniref:CinA family protein n=1 Tax=Glycocaulis sp. TaxID=1969725 RepID=UPI003FA1644F